MANKMTKATVVEMMMNDSAISGNEIYMAYLSNELELLRKKAENKKATAKQTENEGIKTVILDVLANAGSPLKIADIVAASVDLSGFSPQKMSALLTQLVKDGSVVKEYEKKVALFSVA